KHLKRFPGWQPGEPTGDFLTRCEQLQRRDRYRRALGEMSAARRGWFFKSSDACNSWSLLSKRDRQQAKLGAPPATSSPPPKSAREPGGACGSARGGGGAGAPGISKTNPLGCELGDGTYVMVPARRRLVPDMDHRTDATDNRRDLARVG